MVNKKGLREDHFIPSEVEEGEYFVGGKEVYKPDPARFTPDMPQEYKFNFRRRHEWGSPPPFEQDEGVLAQHPLPSVLFTFTETDDTFYEVDAKYLLFCLRDDYKQKGIYELPWNFIVGGDGTVFEARGWDRLPEPFPETPELAGKSFEIAHIGRRGNVPPNRAQISSSWEVVVEGIKKKYLVPLPSRHAFFYT